MGPAGAQHQTGRVRHGFPFKKSRVNPALFLVKGLIRQEPEAKLVGIEGQGPVLVSDSNGGELHASNHIRRCLKMIMLTAGLGPQESMV